MKHYIIVKFAEGTDVAALLEPVEAIFRQTLSIPGVHSVELRPSCSDRPNRYDLMILMQMDPEALPLYDVCPAHLRWKSEYGGRIAKKAIFDCD